MREVEAVRKKEAEERKKKNKGFFANRKKQQKSEERKEEDREGDYKAKESMLHEWQDPKNHDRDAARVTWLGHASTLLQLPPLSSSSSASPPHAATGSIGDDKEDVSTRSINILFDPIFSERCSPSQSAGPQRFTPRLAKSKTCHPSTSLLSLTRITIISTTTR